MVRKQHTGRKKKKGKKNRTCTVDNVEETYKNAPHSFMFHRGRVGKYVKQLVKDVRRVGEPFTARNLQVRDKNVLKDFVSVAGLLHVTHFMIFTKTESSVYMRLCRLPRGPTITFKVVNYCLTPDVVSSLKKPSLQPVQYLHHPLLVMNNFSGEGHHMKMMATMFQNMFPSINVHKVNLNEVRRCVLVNYDSKTKQIDFRHYNIRVAPVGVSRKVRKIVQAKVPNLSRCTDISDYMTHVRYDKLRDLQEMLHGQVQQVPEGTSVRWLSVESAVKMIFKYIDAIILSLEDDKDKTGKAAGLWKYLSTSLFILITALMIDVLSVIGMLSLTFQKDKINLSMIRHNVQSAIQTLNDMKNGSYSVDQLLQDLGDVVEGPASYKNVQFTDNANLRLRFTRLREQYINQLVENLEARFPKDNMDLLECLDMLFNPNRYPDTHGELGNYGMVELDNLCQFYGAILDVDRCKAQFLQFKYLTLSYKQVNDFEQHIKMLLNDYSEMYPDFIKLASIAIIIPVSSAPCERGFSHQNALKTKSRNRLNPERLNRLLMIRLVGPPRCEMNFLSAARAFGALKLRKKQGYTSSESEAEFDGPHNEVILPQDIKARGNIKSTKSAIRLTELGPRMTLELIKIEDGIAAGEVLYHSIVNRTPQEVEQLKQRREKKSKLKESRKLQQMANVKRKEEIKEEHKQRSLAGMKRKQQEIDGEDVVESPETADLEPEGDNDVEYYKDAVGRMPDKDAYIPKGTKRGKPLYDGTGKKQKRDGSSKGRNDKKDGKDFKNKGKDSENNTGKKHSKVKWSEMTLDQRKKAKKKVKERQHIKKYGRKRR